MTSKNANFTKPRIPFLFLLAIVTSVLFLWVIEDFVLTVFLAAILAGLLQPIYRRVLSWTGGRKSLASALTVVLSLIVGIIPLFLLLGYISSQAVEISESAKTWVAAQEKNPDALREQLSSHPRLQQLLPYEDRIVQKASELASKAGTWIAVGLAAGAKARPNCS